MALPASFSSISPTWEARKELDLLWTQLNIASKSFDSVNKSTTYTLAELYNQFYEFQNSVLNPLQKQRSDIIWGMRRT